MPEELPQSKPDPLSTTQGATSTNRKPDGFWERLKIMTGLKSGASLRDDLKDALAEGQTDQAFSPQERVMLENVLGLRELRVADVMVPRADIIAVSNDTTLAELLKVFRTASHSRLPIYGETLDDPKGMLHIRDFLDFLAARAEAGAAKRKRRNMPETAAFDLGNVDLAQTLSSTKLVRPVLYTPPSMPAMDLLRRMQSTRTHIALVIDEYGGTDGLVSIEDLVEMIVGDIEDEHDETGMVIKPLPGGFMLMDARATLEEAGEALGVNFERDEAAEEVDTIGGYLAAIAGRLPTRGELITTPDGIEFEVIDADPRRIKRVRVHPNMKSKALSNGVTVDAMSKSSTVDLPQLNTKEAAISGNSI